jgi:murein DD-endopeptidase MepM/ murein hydrolase activator NlpD
LVREHRYAEAIAYCHRELAASPRCVTLRLLLATSWLALDERARAVAELQSCLRIDPTCIRAKELLRASASSPPPSLSQTRSPTVKRAPVTMPLSAMHTAIIATRSAPAEPPRPTETAGAGIEATAPGGFHQRLRVTAWLGIGIVHLIALWRLLLPHAPALVPASIAARTTPPPMTSPPLPKASPTPSPDKLQLEALLSDVWIHPLEGPGRRMPLRDSRLFGAERFGERPSECRAGHCGVDLGGEVYGEPVRAVHDGVVDFIQRGPNPDHGGHYVRLAHRDGEILSQYFHLAAIPRRLQVGDPVKVGEVIGWVGDSGVKHSGPHLHFTIAVQDRVGHHARYVDPEPLIALWPLHVPTQADESPQISTAIQPGLARGFAARKAKRPHGSRHAATVDD